MESMCRTCMRLSSKLLPLFSDYELCFKIELLTSIRVIGGNGMFPSNICEECVYNINKYYNFRTIVINNDSYFRDRFQLLKLTAIPNTNVTNSIEIKKDQNAIQESPIENIKRKITNTERQNCDSLNYEVIIKDEDFEIEEESDTAVEDQEITDENEITNQENITKQEIDENKPNTDCEKNNENSLNRNYNCIKCDLTFEKFTELDRHRKDTHRKYSICSFCGKSLTTYYLKHHLKTHTSEPATCKVCGKQYKNAMCLQNHMFFHKEADVVCETCGSGFSSLRQYRAHLRTHILRERRSNCTVCGKDISYSGMQQHMRSHTGERPYICQYCGKGFSSTNARKTHIRQHTHEKPYLCEFCPMRFPQRVSLRRHIRSKHSETDKAKDES